MALVALLAGCVVVLVHAARIPGRPPVANAAVKVPPFEPFAARFVHALAVDDGAFYCRHMILQDSVETCLDASRYQAQPVNVRLISAARDGLFHGHALVVKDGAYFNLKFSLRGRTWTWVSYEPVAAAGGAA